MNGFAEAAGIFLASAATCLAVGPAAIRALAKAQCVAPVRYEDCPPLAAYQQTKPATPTMGGLFVLGVGVLVAAAFGGFASREGWLVLGTVAALAAVGLVDDGLKFRGPNAVGLRAVPKLLVALGIGAALGVASPPGARNIELPWASRTVELGGGWVLLAMVVVAGASHAVNLTDGMDGLAAGCAAAVLAALGCWALTDGTPHEAMVPWCASLAGACVGFLWFNSFPASIFMGDVGALGLGGALGAISLLTHKALWLLVIGGIFVAEAASVMLQVASYKWRNKRRIFRVAPIHHHFHLGGVSEPKLIVRFWIVGVLLALLGLTRTAQP